LADLFCHAEPGHPALILPEDGLATTYRAFAERIESSAAALRQSGLQPGQPVAIVLPNGLQYLVSFLAVTRARLIAAPLNPAYKHDEFRFYLQDAGVKAVIAPAEAHPVHEVAREMNLPVWRADRDANGQVVLTGQGLTNRAASPPDLPRPDDIALFLHTSGTTSRPKGVPLTHANLMASIRNIADHYQLTPDDTSLVVMPLFHVHGLIGATLSTFFAGGT